MHPAARRRSFVLGAGVPPRLDAEPDQIRGAPQRSTSNSTVAFLTTQVRPNAIAVSRSARPSVVPATVVSAARTPCVAPVAMTRVTIGPGVTKSTMAIRTKAANSSAFMGATSWCSSSAYFDWTAG
jgi:hypothetical protein